MTSMLLFVDETENEDYFIVTGLLVESQNDIDLIYSRFKKKAKNLNISDKKRAQLFTEFKSTLMDRNYAFRIILYRTLYYLFLLY